MPIELMPSQSQFNHSNLKRLESLPSSQTMYKNGLETAINKIYWKSNAFMA